MANPEHVEILEKGVKYWNDWREENPEVRPDLEGADFRGLKLQFVNLEGANLKEANLKGAELIEANLSEAELIEANLSEAHIVLANLEGADLKGADFSGAFLPGANLKDANLQGADLLEAVLSSVDFSGANLEGADLKGADLLEANLKDANLEGADLEGAILQEAILHRANLSEARLVSANLSYADLSDANLLGVNFKESKLESTQFDDLDLSQILGLETCIHDGPSTIGTNTLVRSKGQIPVEFLRGCGLSDWEIESVKLYQPNLSNQEIIDINYRIIDIRMTQAIQISPLFISYSHADAAFVDKIGEALTEKGVRYWRDIRDAKAGKLERQVDQAMRLNPIVLIVLSETSTNSDWVEFEAGKARKLEKELGRDVLCPIAIDDSWKDCDWPGRLRTQIENYNILPFNGWEDQEVFDRMFAKLLGGLDLFYKK